MPKLNASSAWQDVAAILPHVSRLLLHGPPGTGKTSIAFADDREVFYIPLHEESSVAELIGHFIPIGNRFIWFNGPILIAWERGARVVLDEIDKASGSVMSVLRAVLNDPGVAQLVLPDPTLATLDDATLAEMIANGEGQRIVKPESGFQAIATMNSDPEEFDDEPLLDRFEAIVRIPTPHPDAVNSLPEDLRAAAKRTAAIEDPERRVGIRKWKAFAALRPEVGEEISARVVFGARSGDVMDALKLARPAEAKPKEKLSDSEPAPKSVPTPKTEADPDAPTIYLAKTGKRGRPSAVVCARHGVKMTHKSAVIGADNSLHCRKCLSNGNDALVAAAGAFRRRQLIDGEWINVEA